MDETKGARRRREILDAAADLTTTDGLEGLSFGRLAAEVGLTKAGVAAHFASKQALQLAVIERAAAGYTAPLGEAAARTEPGLERLRALGLAWLDHLESIAYRGGCFFAAAGQDFAGRPGPVRDALARRVRFLLRELEEQASLASRLGELAEGIRPETLAFQIHALAQEANLRAELLDESEAFALARTALEDLLAAASDMRPKETL